MKLIVDDSINADNKKLSDLETRVDDMKIKTTNACLDKIFMIINKKKF